MVIIIMLWLRSFARERWTTIQLDTVFLCEIKRWLLLVCHSIATPTHATSNWSDWPLQEVVRRCCACEVLKQGGHVSMASVQGMKGGEHELQCDTPVTRHNGWTVATESCSSPTPPHHPTPFIVIITLLACLCQQYTKMTRRQSPISCWHPGLYSLPTKSDALPFLSSQNSLN